MPTFGEDFGQKVDLTANIRGILRNYPEGTAILKELVQNADDAGAHRVSICLDCRQHRTDGLAAPALAAFQGPALLAYNDSVFTEEDFRSIQRIGDSLKKASEDQTKIGRFGIGFNAVYHWTDLPSFVSAKKLVMLDPQARFLPDVNPANPGVMVNWVDKPDVLNTFPGQFVPYLFGGGPGRNIDWTRPFQGTLFRLPLRTREQAESSSLSKRALSVDEALAVLDSLQAEAAAMLLFLNSVESIEISHWAEGADSPTLRYHCELANVSSALRDTRAFVKNKARHEQAIKQKRDFPADYSLSINCRVGPSGDSAGSSYVEQWEVCNQLGGLGASLIAGLPANSLLRLVPWGGVAACVSVENPHRAAVQEGLAYCFLPLPVQTGLPVMVNGFFELSSNRRDIWQAGADMTGDGRTRAEWNMSLMQDIIAPCYVRLLSRLKDILGFSSLFQQKWPSIKVGAPWNAVVERTLTLSKKQKLLRICSSVDELNATAAFAPETAATAAGGLKSATQSSSKAAGVWIECEQAILLPERGRHGLDTREDLHSLALLLSLTDQALVICDDALLNTLCTSRTCELVGTPGFVRRSLAKDAIRKKVVSSPTLVPLRSFVLRYVLYDMKAATPSAELNRLPILPLGDGRVADFQLYSETEADRISDLQSMGYKLTKAITALSQSNFQLDRAIVALSGDEPTPKAKQSAEAVPASTVLVIVVDGEEREVFSRAASVLLDHAAVGPKERVFLTHAHLQRCSNIRPFDARLVPDVLTYILPTIFFADKCVPAVGVPDLASVDTFISKFWAYAAVRPDVISAIAQGAAIVPATSRKRGEAAVRGFYPLSAMSNMLVTRVSADTGLPANIADLLQHLGLNIIDPSCFGDIGAMPQAFWDYVCKPSRAGVIRGIETLVRSRPDAFLQLDAQEREQLRLYLCSIEPIEHASRAELEAIKAFPIFSTFSCKSALEYFALKGKSDLKTIASAERIPEILFPKQYVRHSGGQDLAMLKAFGLSVELRSDFYCRSFLPKIAALYETLPKEAVQAMLELLGEFPQLCEENADFPRYLSSCKCVPCGLRKPAEVGKQDAQPAERKFTPSDLYSPANLFDPTMDVFKDLLDDTFFPDGPFQKINVIVALRAAGLQTTMNWHGILTCARRIGEASTDADSAKQSLSRAQSLLGFLNTNMGSLLDVNKPKEPEKRGVFSSFVNMFQSAEKVELVPVDDYVRQLRGIAWVPVMADRTHICMPWIAPEKARYVLDSPFNSRLNSEIWMCSSVKRIIAAPVTNVRLKEAMGWTDALPLDVIAHQLQQLSECFLDLQRKAAASGKHGSDEFDDVGALEGGGSDLQQAREQVTALIPQLYQRLNNGADVVIAGLKEVLYPSSWIWVGKTFVRSSKVALTVSVNAAPYLYQLPQDLRVYGKLLRAFNVKQLFTPSDYIDVLRSMAEDSHVDPKSGIGDALPTSSVDLACSLVTLLSAEGTITSVHVKEIYAPDDGGRLGLTTQLINDDVPWMSGPQFISVRQGCRFVHPNISATVAEKMGVRSLRTSLVAKNLESEQMFGDENKDKMEAFGQAESLTSRLKTILDMYPDGNPIFSELIQNADDAGATVVRIMLDENTYASTSLLDSRMAALQGPSLLVSNDAAFTEADFRSLARIGHGHKLEKVSATGRFGLGFNSTYHLTDTPTFVSGEHLVIFDPHCSHAPGATLNQPGLKIKCAGTSLPLTFRDQFEPFEYFGCDFKTPYPGTLFRFPLRTPGMARESEISSRSYSVSDLNANMDQLVKQLSHYLLFLRSVKCIEVYTMPQGQRVPILLHRASATSETLETTNDQSILRYFDKSRGKAQSSRDQFYTDLIAIPDAKLPSFCQRQRVKVTALQGANVCNTEESEFVIMTGLCGGRAKVMACDPTTRKLKLIPLGSVAACVMRQNASLEEIKAEKSRVELFPALTGQAFCFLPLPVQTRLPVHCNAYWELSSNRRDIWRGDDTQGEAKIRSDWNGLIMKDVLAPMYARLLLRLKSVVEEKHGQGLLNRGALLRLLPCPLPVEPWNALAVALFDIVKGEKLLWSKVKGGMYYSMNQAVLLESALSQSGGSVAANGEELNGVRDELERLLLEENLGVVRVPREVLTPLVELKVAKEVSPGMVRGYFSDVAIPHPTLTGMQNTCFLLRFCFTDVNSKNYEILDGLPLLPLENGKLGTFKLKSKSREGSTLYLVKDSERALLQRASDRLVVDLSKLSSNSVSQSLRDPIFSEMMNTKPMTSADFLAVLRTFLPPHWFKDDVLCVNRAAYFDSDWLALFWKYLIDENVIDQYKSPESPPVLPVIRPLNMHDGHYLVRLAPNVPVLHMTYRTADADVISAFADLGIFVFDAEALGSLSFSDKINALVSRPNAAGVLAAICTHKSDILSKSDWNAWSAGMRQAVRDFLFEEVLGKLNKSQVADADLEVLRKLPVWARSGYDVSRVDGYQAIDLSESVALPPRDVDAALLGRSYFRLRPTRAETDRSCYKLLGVQESSKGRFYALDVIPAIESGAVTGESADAVVADILRNLQKLEAEHPTFSELLKSSRVVRSNGTELLRPTDLYDPTVPQLGALLPANVFPAKIYSDDRLLIGALRTVGLRAAIDCNGFLAAASAIDSEFHSYTASHMPAANVTSGAAANDPSSSAGAQPSLDATIRRAISLFKYLEQNAEELLKTADPGALASDVPDGQILGGGKLSTVASPAKTSAAAGSATKAVVPLKDVDVDGDKRAVGGEWGDKLRSLSWIPVYVNPPVKQGLDVLPWPKALHSTPLSTPSQSVAFTETWMASSTKRISTLEAKNEFAVRLLGWDNSSGGRVAALQLVNIQRLHDEGSATTKLYLEETSGFIVVRLLKTLSDAFQTEDELQIKLWMTVLANRPVVWMAGQFVEPSRVAFHGLPGVQTEPYLFTVTSELLAYKPVLSALGVRDSFGPKDIAMLMQKMYESFKTNSKTLPMTSQQTVISLGILKLLVTLLNDLERVAKAESEAAAAETTLPIEEEGAAVAENRSPQKAHAINIDDLRPIYIPDKQGYLVDSHSLTYDDAPWISPGIVGKNNLMRFVHTGLTCDDARVLGAQSLREQLFAGDEIMCPTAKGLKKVLGNDSCMDTLTDLLALSDALSATRADIVFDCRTHRKESLMHPGLADVQGAAIVFHIAGPVLKSEDITRVLTASQFMLDSSRNVSATAVDASSNAVSSPYPSSGKRLSAAFAMTDCLQVISGKEFYVFDPCGLHLFASELPSVEDGKTERTGSASRAQRCLLTMRSRFPDQFAPFLQLPFGLEEHLARSESFPGMLIRMPLRRIASGISTCVPNDSMIRRSARSFADMLMGTLLFSNSIVAGSCRYIRADSITPNPAGYEFEMSLATAADKRNSRRQLLVDKAWKKQGAFTSLFSSYTAPVTEYQLQVRKKHLPNGWLYGKLADEDDDRDDAETQSGSGAVAVATGAVASSASALSAGKAGGGASSATADPATQIDAVSTWFVASTQGAGVLKDVALRGEYRSHKLPPFCTIAMRFMDDEELKLLHVKPPTGMSYCNGAPVSVTGLPFHCEGPFIQDMNDRCVPFVPSKSRTQGSRSESGQISNSPVAKRSSIFGWDSSSTDKPKMLTLGEIEAWNKAILSTVFSDLFKRAIYQMALKAIPTPGFYKYWPFFPMMTEEVAKVASDCRIYAWLENEMLFLTRVGFEKLPNVLLPTLKCNVDMLSYIQSMLPIALCPMQLSQNFDMVQGNYNRLTPAKLRGSFEKDAAKHCNRLRSRYTLIKELLRYCVSDLEDVRNSNAGPFAKRQAYQALAGCPLLPMSDGSVGAFPKFARDQVCFAPMSLHTVLPRMRKFFVHPTALSGFPLFQDKDGQEALRLNPFSAKVLGENIQLLLPAEWRRTEALLWGGYREVSTSAGDLLDSGPVSSGPSELAIFALWKEVLSDETQDNLDGLRDWPMLPAVSRGRRLLLSPAYLYALFYVFPTAALTRHRSFLENEVGRHCALQKREANAALGDAADAGGMASDAGGNEDWAWTSPPAAKRVGDRITTRSLGYGLRAKKGRSSNVGGASNAAGGGSAAAVEEEEEEEDTDGLLPAASRISGRQVDSNGGAGGVQIIVPAEAVTDGEYAGNAPVVATAVGGNGSNTEGLRVVEADAILPVNAAAAAAAAANAAPVGNVDVPLFDVASPAANRDADAHALDEGLRVILDRLGVPFLDMGIFGSVPRAIATYLSSAPPVSKRLLTCLTMLSSEHELYAHTSASLLRSNVTSSPSGTLQDTTPDPEPLLSFDSLSVEDRVELLCQIAPSSRGARAEGLESIRKLRLFTEKQTGRAISIFNCARVYCCQDESALDAIPSFNASAADSGGLARRNEKSNGPGSSTAGSSNRMRDVLGEAVILITHPRLNYLYELLGVKELTAALAVREFTVPALLRLPGVDRLVIMRSLSSKWATFRNDRGLIDLLKPITFIPMWQPARNAHVPIAKSIAGASTENAAVGGGAKVGGGVLLPLPPPPPTTGRLTPTSIADNDVSEAEYFGEPGADSLLRKASDVLSWKNKDLLEALNSDRQGKFFAPPWLRDDMLHAMLLDLGMSENMSKEVFLEVARDIELDMQNKGAGSSEAVLRDCERRSRVLLRFVRDNDRSIALFDNDLAKRVSKLRFVPVQVPICVESGGHVMYETRISSFSETLAPSVGALGFTCLPVLENDIAPHQMFHSHLGVTTAPNINLVVKHLLLLTADGKGNSLDRWNNASYTVINTFGAIFEQLRDNWEKLSAKLREQLFNQNIIPVGDMLIRPGRLYFRLNDDLSPFMHEVPRYFGQHEAFLKKLGVRESPAARDYSLFLTDLELECRGHSLNTNELRAIVAIIESISRERSEGTDGASGSINDVVVYVPDEDSVLRNAQNCLMNDDPAVRDRAGALLFTAAGMYMIHPSLNVSVSRQLGVLPISQVLVERMTLAKRESDTSPEYAQAHANITASLACDDVVRCLSALVSKAREPVGSLHLSALAPTSTAADVGVGEGEQTLSMCLQALQFNFVPSLQTVLAVVRSQKERVHPETLMETMSFLERSATAAAPHRHTVHINTSLLQYPITPEVAVSLCLCKLLHVDTSLAATMAALLAGGATSGKRVFKALEVGTDAVTLRERQRGMPGERLCATDRQLVELKPLRAFRVGEAVAFSVESAAGRSGPHVQASLDSLRYARVLSVPADTEATGLVHDIGLRRVLLKTGADSTSSALTTEIYSFRSAREAALNGGGGGGGARPATTFQKMVSSLSGGVGGSPAAGAATPANAATANQLPPPPLTAGAGAAPPPPPPAVAVAAVSHRDIVDAISGLMLRAGLPVGLEQTALASKVLEMESAVRRAHDDLQEERQHLLESRTIVSQMNAVFKCQVCLDEDFDHALNPCGHTMCGTCLTRMGESGRSMKCPFCRQAIVSRIKLFLPEPQNEETL